MPTADPAFSSPARLGSWLAWILRLGTAACFIGHGALGISHPPAWTAYFAAVGIGPGPAATLMPLVGVIDVALGLLVAFFPIRVVVLYMAAWGLWTAVLRPLAGESAWEALERAGNYGVPLALFLLAQAGGLKTWVGGRFRLALDEATRERVGWVLRLTTVFLLFGHGVLGWILRKPMFADEYALIGLPGPACVPLIGSFECLLALAVLLAPVRWLLFSVVGWKLATEALCPLAGAPFWVFLEHGGSYAAPLALALLLPASSHPFPLPTSQPPAPVRN